MIDRLDLDERSTTTAELATSLSQVLSIEGVSKSFGTHMALHPTDLSIGQGEFVTLLGPSGCGKTTLLRIVAGLETPSGGRLFSRNTDLTGLRPEQRPFNMVFQSYALFPHLNVFENVAYGLRAAGHDQKTVAAKVDAALDLVGLAQQRTRAVDELSGGMSQRVALVRAIVNEPKILLLDEPLAALDLQLRKRMQIELRAIQRRLGTTFVLVTHDQEEALAMSDRIVVMQAGRVEQVGSPQDIYRRPASKFVAGFIGETSLVPCEVERRQGTDVDVTLANGARARFACHVGAEIRSGQSGVASIRPEDLRLAAPDRALFKGTVANMVFTGASTRMTVMVEPDIELRINTTEDDSAAGGDMIGIDLAPGAGAFIPDEDRAVGLR